MRGDHSGLSFSDVWSTLNKTTKYHSVENLRYSFDHPDSHKLCHVPFVLANEGPWYMVAVTNTVRPDAGTESSTSSR